MYKSNDDITTIGTGLVDRTLPKEAWTHAAHFAAAFWLLKHPDIDPFLEMPDFIRAYNIATGGVNNDEEGYHETITQASLKAAKHFLGRAPASEPLYETVNRFLGSEYGSSNWILNHWSKSMLFSVKARKSWIEPDQKPLPF